MSFALLSGDFDAERAATSIRTLIVPPGNSQIFYTLLELVGVILLVLLLVTFIMRSALVLVLVVGAPLALACHTLPHTIGVARFWWRAFGGLLIIQVAQSLTLTLAVRIFFNQDGRLLLGIAPTGQLVNLLLAICLLIILVRIPSWISRQILIGGGRSSAITRIVKSVVAYKLTAPLLAGLNLGRGRRHGGRKAITSAVAGKVLAGVIGGPAGLATTAITAASASSAGPRPSSTPPPVPSVPSGRRTGSPPRSSTRRPLQLSRASTGPLPSGSRPFPRSRRCTATRARRTTPGARQDSAR
ncbi:MULTISPECIES: conjugal transfer protein TrbL family protein [unclassified Nonomuraea]|uniref:conjugal transfer protein TrbL family protein n=1 Tax=unclassified Nonomuraea TaxID=2593643 RepID=UPI0033C89C18